MRLLSAAGVLLLGLAALHPDPAALSQPERLGVHPLAGPSPLRWVPPRATRSRQEPARRLSVTCYLPTGHRTASGRWPHPGMAAGNRWPFGTRLRVEGVGVVTITDRIGWGSDLDLFMESASACGHFGRRSLRVTVLPR